MNTPDTPSEISGPDPYIGALETVCPDTVFRTRVKFSHDVGLKIFSLFTQLPLPIPVKTAATYGDLMCVGETDINKRIRVEEKDVYFMFPGQKDDVINTRRCLAEFCRSEEIQRLMSDAAHALDPLRIIREEAKAPKLELKYDKLPKLSERKNTKRKVTAAQQVGRMVPPKPHRNGQRE